MSKEMPSPFADSVFRGRGQHAPTSASLRLRGDSGEMHHAARSALARSGFGQHGSVSFRGPSKWWLFFLVSL